MLNESPYSKRDLVGWALLATPVLCLTLWGCATASRTVEIHTKSLPVAASQSSAVKPGTLTRGDGTSDSTGGQYDADDAPLLHFGRRASSSERRAVTAIIKRYFQSAVEGDGAAGCGLLAATIVRTAPKDDGGATASQSPPSCPVFITRLFALYRREVAIVKARLSVRKVLVKGNQGEALLGLPKKIEIYIPVIRERGTWKIDQLFDAGMP